MSARFVVVVVVVVDVHVVPLRMAIIAHSAVPTASPRPAPMFVDHVALSAFRGMPCFI